MCGFTEAGSRESCGARAHGEVDARHDLEPPTCPEAPMNHRHLGRIATTVSLLLCTAALILGTPAQSFAAHASHGHSRCYAAATHRRSAHKCASAKARQHTEHGVRRAHRPIGTTQPGHASQPAQNASPAVPATPAATTSPATTPTQTAPPATASSNETAGSAEAEGEEVELEGEEGGAEE
jgi:hypothetical protein